MPGKIKFGRTQNGLRMYVGPLRMGMLVVLRGEELPVRVGGVAPYPDYEFGGTENIGWTIYGDTERAVKSTVKTLEHIQPDDTDELHEVLRVLELPGTYEDPIPSEIRTASIIKQLKRAGYINPPRHYKVLSHKQRRIMISIERGVPMEHDGVCLWLMHKKGNRELLDSDFVAKLMQSCQLIIDSKGEIY